MKTEDAEEYTQALGQVVAGGWRQIALGQRLGVPKALGLSTQQWVEDRLGGYVKLSVAERREAVAELKEEGNSQREIAEVLGVTPMTVSRDVTNVTPPDDQDAGSLADDAQGVTNVTPLDTITAIAADNRLRAEAEKPAPHVSHNSGENEWYTPTEYIESARQVMGTIDLDPASSAEANGVVMATTYYDLESDGLTQPWSGNVWINPPYAQPLVDRFCHRLVSFYKGGEVTSAVVLVNNATETAWFREVMSVAQAVCFPKGRVRFWSPAGTAAAPLQGQAVIYLGDRAAQFQAEFERFGIVLEPYRR